MEMRRVIGFSRMLAFCLVWAMPVISNGQATYSIKDGSMQIMLSKKLTQAKIDSFSSKFDLKDLPLYQSLKTNSFDSLQKLGWMLEVNTPEMLVITKPLQSSKGMGDFANKIIDTQKPTMAEIFPVVSDNVVYGCNYFKKGKFPFAVNGSDVTFYLKNNLRANHVKLSGSFNDWNPDGIGMQKTDSGWIAHVQLKEPGKYWYKFIVDGNWEIDNDNLLSENDDGNKNSIYYLPNYTFTLDTFKQAKSVYLAGSFNNWNPVELPMVKTIKGWKLSLYLSEGTHLYKFIVDRNWITDPGNPNRLPDGNNGYHSVLAFGKPYLFRLEGYTEAKNVVLAGTFNQWHQNELYMKKTSTGWELPYIIRPGNYQYKFIVDGKWITDPANPLVIANDEGTGNSFLILEPNYTFHLKGFDNAKKVYLAGDFDNWDPASLLMHHVGNEWIFNLHLSPGKHTYKFVADGQWITDPDNKLFEDDGNSVIWISR
jgi:hypothetical protein